MNRKVSCSDVVALAAVSLLVLAGCSSTGVELAEEKVASIDEVRASVVDAKEQLDATMGALKEVAASTNADPRPPYAKFTEALARFDSSAAEVRTRSDDMMARSKAYFDNWGAQLESIQNPDLKARAELARKEFTTHFAKIREAGQAVKANYEPLSSDLHDIRKYLDLNLNAQGIASIKDTVEKCGKNSDALNAAIDGWFKALDAARTALAPFNVPESVPAPAPEGGAQK